MTPVVRILVGLGIPFLAIVPGVAVLSRLDTTVIGLPVAIAWLFFCIPLTSGCLAVCWFVYDRHMPDETSQN
jgi:hypothetical protein